MKWWLGGLAVGIVSLCTHGATHGQTAFDSGRAAFSIRLNDELFPYREFATFAMPRERLTLGLTEGATGDYELRAEGARLRASGSGSWQWNAPRDPGVYELTLTRRADNESVLLRVFVKVPATRLIDGSLDGYEIGDYPPTAGRGSSYAPPTGFVRVREEDLWLPLSPHFVLGQFVSDTSDIFPKYIDLRERLLLKLELLLERVNERGYPTRSFSIVSGYRTPVFNESIGGTPYSRHIYGDAAGIIIDRDAADGVMDDLDGDGRSGTGDVELLFGIADELFREPRNDYLRGGLSAYRAVPWRGPYLHLDARGDRARWDSDQDIQRLPQPIEPKHLRDFPRPGRLAWSPRVTSIAFTGLADRGTCYWSSQC